MDITAQDLKDLQTAKRLLEHPGLAVRLVDWVGQPIERATHMLPAGWADKVHAATQAALAKGLQFAVATMGNEQPPEVSNAFHRLSVAASGLVGGVGGLPSLALELPVTTVLMLRSIADIARSQGEDVHTLESQLECLKVFALGGRAAGDDALDSSYFVIRAALARETAQAAQYIARHGLVEGGPAIVRLLTTIGARFGVVVSEKVAAQAVPIVGALGGAAVNAFFMSHFQDVACGHFTIRRLERRYGADEIRGAYAGV
jgi:hypothetical protein